MRYTKKKRAKKDRCNICSQISDLTWDHVPPKFCNNDSAKDYMLAFGVMDKRNTKNKFPYTSQNGIKFRSICSNCNNYLLGVNLDPEYKALVDNLFLRTQSKLIMPDSFTIEVKPNRLARAVVGHMLAAKNFFDGDCIIDKELRQYFLDTRLSPPADMQLYCFLYPFETIMIVRDVLPFQISNVPNAFSVPNSMVSCIYSLPVAFLLTQDCPDLPFDNVFRHCSNNFNEIDYLRFKKSAIYFPETRVVRSPFWPCNITDSLEGPAGILGGQSSNDIVMAINRKQHRSNKK